MYIEKRITIIGFLTMFVVGVSDLIVVGILSPMALAFDVTPSLIGQLVTIYAVSFAVLSPILTKFTASLENKTTLLISMVLFVILTFFVTVINSFWLLCFIRVLLAGCASLITVKLMSIGANVVQSINKARVVANIYVGFSAANILGIPLGTLLASRFSWTVPFYMIALMTAVCFFLILLFIPKENDGTRQTIIDSQKNQYQVTNKKGLLIILLFLLIMMTSNSILFTYIEPIVKNGGHSLYIVSIALFLAGVAGVLGSKLGNILSENIGYFLSGTIIIFSYILSLLILLIFSQSACLVLLSIFIWNLFHWGTNPTVQFGILKFMKGDPSQIFSYNISILNLGIGLGSLIGGILASIDPYFNLSLWTSIALAVFSFLVLLPIKNADY